MKYNSELLYECKEAVKEYMLNRFSNPNRTLEDTVPTFEVISKSKPVTAFFEKSGSNGYEYLRKALRDLVKEGEYLEVCKAGPVYFNNDSLENMFDGVAENDNHGSFEVSSHLGYGTPFDMDLLWNQKDALEK